MEGLTVLFDPKKDLTFGVFMGGFGVQRRLVYETDIFKSGGVFIQLNDTIQYLRRHLRDTDFHLIHRFL